MMSKNNNNEKRAYLRGKLHFLVRYKTENGETGVVSSINICAGGALLRIKKECKIGQTITLLINFIDHPSREIATKARALRVQKYRNYYKTAVEFTKISTEDKNAIDAFMQVLFEK